MYLQDDVLAHLLEEEPNRLETNKKTGQEAVKYNVSDILKKGKGMSEQNVTYRLISSILYKVGVPCDIVTCLNQAVCSSVKKSMLDVVHGDASLRSYKNNIPIPFSAKAISNIHKGQPNENEKESDGRYYFNLFGIPFICYLGRDRSNNRNILDHAISGTYKMCSSSLAFEKKTDRVTGKTKQKLFLHLCVDIPDQHKDLDPKKVLYAYLGIAHPIQCMFGEKCDDIRTESDRWFFIDDTENFVYRRLQIQEARRRCQISCSYNKGGHGRKRKLQAMNRYAEMERNYVDSRLHYYSRKLVNAAIEHGCGTIFLVDQKSREDEAKDKHAKGDSFILRNWSYYGLKQKIAYKSKMAGIILLPKKNEGEDDSESELS